MQFVCENRKSFRRNTCLLSGKQGKNVTNVSSRGGDLPCWCFHQQGINNEGFQIDEILRCYMRSGGLVCCRYRIADKLWPQLLFTTLTVLALLLSVRIRK